MCMRNRCIYHSNGDQGCDYILHMMAQDKTECRRPCKAGAACTVYAEGKKKRWNPEPFTKNVWRSVPGRISTNASKLCRRHDRCTDGCGRGFNNRRNPAMAV